MTMPLTGKKRNRARAGLPDLRPKAAGGFTIVELMVVLLIMMLLLAVLAPTVQKIHRTIMRVTALTTVRLIEGGCKAYYDDFDDQYPPSTHVDYADWSGRELLVLFLTGYGPDNLSDGTPGTNLATDDGYQGFGRRVEKRGRRFGPYNGTENVKTRLSDENSRPVFVDAFDEEVYYYRFDPLVAPEGGYNNDNDADDNKYDGPIEVHGTDYAKNNTAVPPYYFRRDFILVTAGPDGVFQDVDDYSDTDDITNFLEEQ